MTPQRSLSFRAWSELLLLGAIWGAVFLPISLVVREVPVLTSVAMRLGTGAAVLWAYVVIRGLSVPCDLRTWFALAVMGAINNAIPFTLITWAQKHIESGLAAILNSTTAVFGVVIASVFLSDERLTPHRAAGVLLGFSGVVVISGPALLRGFDPTSVAQLAMLCAAISYGFAALWARLHLSALAPQVAAAGMTTMSALMIAVLALWVEGAPTFAYSPRAWVSLAYMAVIGTAAAYLLYYRILAMAGSGNLSLVTLLVAPIAVIIGAVVLDEVMAPRVYAGLFLLTLGLIALDGRLLRLRRQN